MALNPSNSSSFEQLALKGLMRYSLVVPSVCLFQKRTYWLLNVLQLYRLIKWATC